MPENTNEAWGPLSRAPVSEIPPDSAPWRDNGYLCFWDVDQDIYGALHVSTSPNAEGRRARLTVHVGDQKDEVVEPVESGTVSSASITFDFGDRFAVDTENLRGELRLEPRFHLADYTGGKAPSGFEFDPSSPLQHYQRAASLTGTLEIRGVEYEINGEGVRDRTWGFRDESVNLRETIGLFWVFPDYALSAFRILKNDGVEAVAGYRMEQDRAVPVTGFSVTRDASGLFAGTTIKMEDGESIDVRAHRRGGHFSPMGFERTAPTHSAYDEFSVLETSDGVRGFGMIEQGVVRQMY